MRTLAGLSSRVAAVGAGRLLDVEGPLACQVARECVSKVILKSLYSVHPLSSIGSSNSYDSL
jgi:hypothetical protein